MQWQKRWVVLDGSYLLYYKDVQRNQLKGVISLAGSVTRAVHSKPNEFQISNPRHTSGSMNLLGKEGKTKLVYHWQTRTLDEAGRWIVALQAAAQTTPALRQVLDMQEVRWSLPPPVRPDPARAPLNRFPWSLR